ncbi:hypothetical protein K505DRAFT_250155 [Melanomma pulvis-pyrius CBS 109.77]|uniref:Complex 1 LYR protein domain-containing protein n=1 Tax=Melanomma pulvis-pyrius CBS 109.77 TaxID=1314802 RepID=A0A6A6X3J1_9PLEO|nr:hypothetical protein K505DRAFT_250155 [Melanomma pulvis-pyrius CBS 109.77]
MARSGLQRDVLSLYRQCMRAVREKPAETRENFRSFARTGFRDHITVNKKDFSTIEYLLRKGRRQLEIYQDPGIRNISK